MKTTFSLSFYDFLLLFVPGPNFDECTAVHCTERVLILHSESEARAKTIFAYNLPRAHTHGGIEATWRLNSDFVGGRGVGEGW
jgi:CRISPR/Cas system CMR subunit Cmr4 (Cas7 group RAMP superfamily)